MTISATLKPVRRLKLIVSAAPILLPNLESIWELELAASNGGGTGGGTRAELSGNDQIISIWVVLAHRPRLAIGRPRLAISRPRVARWRGSRRYAQMRAGARRKDPMCTVRVPSRSIDNPGFISRTACRPRPPRLYPVRCPPRTLPAAIALVACLPSLFATAVATPLTTTQSGPPCSLFAHHAPEIAYNHLAAVHAPPEPRPLATAVPNVAP
ncbi:hypothetical protein B0H11DRAFT_2213764 [Mycena galericulata]|nr:hypothetical protein B0H11DRAFT_2213764 [Mycena galericulata]